MQKKYLIRAALILLLISGSYLVLWSTTQASSSKDICCENKQECLEKKEGADAPAEMLWDNFSRHFFSFIGSSN